MEPRRLPSYGRLGMSGANGCLFQLWSSPRFGKNLSSNCSAALGVFGTINQACGFTRFPVSLKQWFWELANLSGPGPSSEIRISGSVRASRWRPSATKQKHVVNTKAGFLLHLSLSVHLFPQSFWHRRDMHLLGLNIQVMLASWKELRKIFILCHRLK